MRSTFRLVTGATLLAAIAVAPSPSIAEHLADMVCRGAASSSAAELPDELIPAAAKALEMDARFIRGGGYYRCSHGRLFVCAVGANLNCGKADTERNPDSVVAYCLHNPNNPFIPMAVTGHATVYSWKCVGGAPQLLEGGLSVDADGYVADNWRELK